MAARSSSRGWPLIWRHGRWVYADTGAALDPNRPCRRCGRPPAPDGADACLGTLPGVVSACCGHGIGPPVVIHGPLGDPK